ncbi:hypothetical protein BV25DRAFT_1842193 [Artomyces pyxidatus]|uniref:Uncharacterized protein n=1 Tax=Artomyces pyxidatus TaxID=48021 RepID=A0ACB8SL40_9AGAM|nr:hypothetical protein BV25DRAFT_1842193 [Artomyces pyxidatus]
MPPLPTYPRISIHRQHGRAFVHIEQHPPASISIPDPSNTESYTDSYGRIQPWDWVTNMDWWDDVRPWRAFIPSHARFGALPPDVEWILPSQADRTEVEPTGTGWTFRAPTALVRAYEDYVHRINGLKPILEEFGGLPSGIAQPPPFPESATVASLIADQQDLRAAYWQWRRPLMEWLGYLRWLIARGGPTWRHIPSIPDGTPLRAFLNAVVIPPFPRGATFDIIEYQSWSNTRRDALQLLMDRKVNLCYTWGAHHAERQELARFRLQNWHLPLPPPIPEQTTILVEHWKDLRGWRSTTRSQRQAWHQAFRYAELKDPDEYVNVRVYAADAGIADTGDDWDYQDGDTPDLPETEKNYRLDSIQPILSPSPALRRWIAGSKDRRPPAPPPFPFVHIPSPPPAQDAGQSSHTASLENQEAVSQPTASPPQSPPRRIATPPLVNQGQEALSTENATQGTQREPRNDSMAYQEYADSLMSDVHQDFRENTPEPGQDDVDNSANTSSPATPLYQPLIHRLSSTSPTEEIETLDNDSLMQDEDTASQMSVELHFDARRTGPFTQWLNEHSGGEDQMIIPHCPTDATPFTIENEFYPTAVISLDPISEIALGSLFERAPTSEGDDLLRYALEFGVRLHISWNTAWGNQLQAIARNGQAPYPLPDWYQALLAPLPPPNPLDPTQLTSHWKARMSSLCQHHESVYLLQYGGIIWRIIRHFLPDNIMYDALRLPTELYFNHGVLYHTGTGHSERPDNDFQDPLLATVLGTVLVRQTPHTLLPPPDVWADSATFNGFWNELTETRF